MRALTTLTAIAVVLTLTAAACGSGTTPTSPPPAQTPTGEPEQAAPRPPTEGPTATATETAVETGNTAEEKTDQPPGPENPGHTIAVISTLTLEEQQCLPDRVAKGLVETDIAAITGGDHARTLQEATACLSDPGLISLTVIPALQAHAPVTAEQRECLAGGIAPGMIRTTLEQADNQETFTDAYFATLIGVTTETARCLGTEAAQNQGLTEADLATVQCLAAETGGPDKILQAVLSLDPDRMTALEEAAARCPPPEGSSRPPTTEQNRCPDEEEITRCADEFIPPQNTDRQERSHGDR